MGLLIKDAPFVSPSFQNSPDKIQHADQFPQPTSSDLVCHINHRMAMSMPVAELAEDERRVFEVAMSSVSIWDRRE